MRVTLNEENQAIWQRYNFEYLRYKYKLAPDDAVIDIGAYRGEWAAEIFRRYGCKLIVIEPGPWIVGFPHGEVINKAAGVKDGAQKFGGAYYYTSAFEDGDQEYETFDINSLLEKYDEIALAKMNVEGSEYQLLERIYNGGHMKRIRNLQVQFHLIEGQDCAMRYEVISELLNETHSLTWRYPFVWENWRRDVG